ncbi:hypothetical protein J6590_022253 [Homalodisca vitripennis]|nr:hypothetical protein J6590_022253 [Homalodisca vitripennis]
MPRAPTSHSQSISRRPCCVVLSTCGSTNAARPPRSLTLHRRYPLSSATRLLVYTMSSSQLPPGKYTRQNPSVRAMMSDDLTGLLMRDAARTYMEWTCCKPEKGPLVSSSLLVCLVIGGLSPNIPETGSVRTQDVHRDFSVFTKLNFNYFLYITPTSEVMRTNSLHLLFLIGVSSNSRICKNNQESKIGNKSSPNALLLALKGEYFERPQRTRENARRTQEKYEYIQTIEPD